MTTLTEAIGCAGNLFEGYCDCPTPLCGERYQLTIQDRCAGNRFEITCKKCGRRLAGALPSQPNPFFIGFGW